MKKLLSLFLISTIAFSINAQDKKFQMGLVTGTTFNWIKVQTSEIERNGIGSEFIIGVAGNYLFNDNIGLASGVQFDIGNYKINYGNAVTSSEPSGTVFYSYEDTDIKKFKDGIIQEPPADSAGFELLTRKLKTKYITVPLFLKFQTNMIGQFKYYGKFGLRTSFLAGVRMDDEGYMAQYSPASDSTATQFTRTGTSVISNENMKPENTIFKRGASFLKMSLGVYAGAEWNFTGNTFLYLEGGFNYGIVPGMNITSGHLANQVTESDGTVSLETLDIQNNPQHMIEVKLGLLF